MKYVNHLLLIEKPLWLIVDVVRTSLTKDINKPNIGPYLINSKGKITINEKFMSLKDEKIQISADLLSQRLW